MTVSLSAAPSERLEVPIEVTFGTEEFTAEYTADDPDQQDYRVSGLSSGGLRFTPNRTSATFRIRANPDFDVEDETIGLSFGRLPAGVRAGDPSTATVTIRDTPNRPEGLTATAGHGEVTLRWDAPDPEDPNPGIRGWQYQVRLPPQQPDFGDWMPMGLGGFTDRTVFQRTEHTVEGLPNGVKHLFRIRAYTRGYGLASASAEATPNGLLAEAYRGAVVLRWIDDPEGEDIARWEYQVREVLEPGQGDWSGWSSAGGESSARSHTVRGLTNGVLHRFQVQGLTAAGVTELTWPTPRDGSVVQATPQASLPPPPNEAPSKPEGEPAVSIAEHTTDTGEDYTSLDPEGTAIQWSLTGDDAAHLQVTAQGRLIFRDPAPDFEDPKDKDKNRVYEVEVVASDGELSSPPLAVTVTVEDVNEDGALTLTLPPSPLRVGQELLAEVTDPDGVTDATWTWQGREPLPAGAPESEPGTLSETREHTLGPAAIGQQVRMSVTYTDAHGSQTLESDWTEEIVIDVPSAPRELKAADRGARRLEFIWKPPAKDNRSAITGYGFRYGTPDGELTRGTESGQTRAPQPEVTSWTNGTLGAVTRHELTGLLPNKNYRFELWAINAAGDGTTHGVWAMTVPTLEPLRVAFAQSSQDALEAGDAVSVSANLSPAADRIVKIPVSVTAATGTESGDYRVTWPDGADTLVFSDGESAQSLQIAAQRDTDGDTESVNLAFGTLPASVTAGSQATSVVRLVDRYTVPCAPQNLSVAAADRRVTLTWDAPSCDGGLTITGYTFQDSAAGGSWSEWKGASTGHVVRDLDNDKLHTFRVRAANDLGSGAFAEITATPVNTRPNKPVGRASVSFAENSTDSVATYVLSDPDGPEGLSLDIGGADADLFEASGDTLYFENAPDYENPADDGGNNVFNVTLKTHDGRLKSLGLDVTVTVTDQGPGKPVVRLGEATATTFPVTWEATGSNLVGFELQHCSGSNCRPTPSWTLVTISDGTDRSHTLKNRQPDTEYGVRLRAKDDDDEYSAWSDSVMGSTLPERNLEIVGASDTTFAEMSSSSTVAPYRAVWSTGEAVSSVAWTLSGADADSLVLSQSGVLSFDIEPNYEKPTDANGDTVWSVTVGARTSGPPADQASKDVSVRVTNEDDPGKVELSTRQPQIGDSMTAVLTDEDGVVGPSVEWTWLELQPNPNNRGARSPGSVAPTHNPQSAGLVVQARANYDDRHGSDKVASSRESEPIRHRSLQVSFNESSYDAVEGGSAQSVRVNISPNANRTVRVPITFDPPSGDYSVKGLDSSKRLVFYSGNSHRSFPITATVDPDRDDESVTLGFGSLPTEVTAGTPAATTVNLDDRNQPPSIDVFDDDNVVSVPENTTAVGTFTATDPESQTIRWSVSNNSHIFSIGSSSGQLSFKQAPNYESGTTSYSVTVRARDSENASSTKTATINVTDVAERPPAPNIQSVSGQSRTSIRVRWTAPSTTGIPSLTGYNVQYKKSTDSDSEYGPHSFSGTGTSTTISGLEIGTTYNVQVNAVNDEGTSGWSTGTGSTQQNTPPTIDGLASVTFKENATGTVATYQKSDQDGDATTWLNLSGTDASYFNNLSSSGKLTFSNPPNYETKSSYSIRVGATDSYDNTYKDVTVTLTNVGPPAKPSISISPPSSGGHKNLSVSWSVSSSSTTADLSGWRLLHCTGHCKSFTEAGWTSQTFGSSTTSTTLTGLRSGTQYFVRVLAQSGEGDSPWSNVRSAYTNQNTAPVISGTARQNVDENTTAVGTYTATDAEGDGITWDIYGTDSGFFSYTSNSSSLALSFSLAPDYENAADANENNLYVVRLRATDNGNPSADTTKLVNAIVQDVPAPKKMATPSVAPSGGTGTLDVSWTAPTSGAPITSYTMEYCYYAFRSDGSAPENPDDNEARQAGQCSEATVSGTKRDTTLTSLFSNTLYGVKMKATSKEGTGPFSTQRTATTRSAAAKALAEQMVLTGMEGLAALAAPNPFNPSTTIYFQVPEAEEVSLVIYGLNGQVVRTLIEGRSLRPGIYDVFWEGTEEEGRPVATGVYLYRLRAGEQALVQKMTLLQ